jgi:hypothetical protein
LPEASGYQQLEQRHEIGWTNSDGGRGAPTTTADRQFLLASVLPLGSVDADGKLVGRLSKIHELQGSLYPPRVGAEVSLRYDMAYMPNRSLDSSVTSKCRIVGKVSAATLNAQLPGEAWQANCQTSSLMDGKTNERTYDMYVLDELGGISSQQLGIFDLSQKSTVIPNGRHEYKFMDSVHTIDGYRITARD